MGILKDMDKSESAAAPAQLDERLAEYRDTVAGIRRGLAQAQKGLGRSVDDVFDTIERGK